MLAVIKLYPELDERVNNGEGLIVEKGSTVFSDNEEAIAYGHSRYGYGNYRVYEVEDDGMDEEELYQDDSNSKYSTRYKTTQRVSVRKFDF